MTAAEIGADRLRGILNEVFGGEIGEIVRRHFLTEFAVLFASSIVDAEKGESHLWHCDAGPRDHLKILIYLARTDGATLIMNRDETVLYQKVGYGFVNGANRVEHLEQIAAEHHISCVPTTLCPHPGGAIVFEPTRVLHRGVLAKGKPRRMLQIGVIPWPHSWDTAFDNMWEFVAGNVGAGFPRMEIQAGT